MSPENENGETGNSTDHLELYRCVICDRIIALKQGSRAHVARMHDVEAPAEYLEPLTLE
jgi:hypothetical protein